MPSLPIDTAGATAGFNELVRDANLVAQRSVNWYRDQTSLIKVLLGIVGIIGISAGITVVIFHKYLINALVYISDQWHNFSYGGPLLFSLIFIVGFPPLIGFSTLSILTGMIYGFPGGWPLLASASILGSLCSFLINRLIFHDYAVKLVNKQETFRAFSEILREDKSLMLLILIRLCPLPYSLSNCAFAVVPDLPILRFLLSSIITSPKLLIHIFVGYKLKNLGDDTKTTSAKIVDFISILLTGLATTITTYIIYGKMQQKLTSYHENQNGYPDRIIFGNFEDDLELGGSEIELNSADFDDDNFIIDDEAEERPLISPPEAMDFIDDDIIIQQELQTSTKARDY
ncbi:uncharacterized protein RJT21DRAFT_26347 [Scheffersomyces amazonensis]|uniref:uncharacterized protein n=1 Tax=Scheffersomyces amazonensis TaxID=1078765 RepID=UPI00315CC5C5